jgi:hypothetical protein
VGLGVRLRRLDQRVLGPGQPPTPPAEWCSKREAARTLGITRFGVSVLAFNGGLDFAQAGDGRLGVTRRSVEAELEWREHAGWLRRRVRGVVNLAGWVLPGVP